MRLSNVSVGLRQHVGGDAAEPRPDGDDIVPAAGEQMQLVGHLDLPRQRGRQRDQQHRVAGIVHGDHRDGDEDDGETDDAAHRAHAFARDDSADLGGQCLAQPAFEAGEPEPQVVAVAAEDVVPRGIALPGNTVVHALVFEIGACNRSLQRPLHQQQGGERAGIGERQAEVDFDSQYDGVENHSEQQLQREFELIHQIEEALERLAGEERLDLLARRLVAEQLDLAAVLAREAQHELAEAAIAGPFGEHPADHASDIGGRLRRKDQDEIGEQKLADGDLARGIDDEPGRRRGEHRFGHHQQEHPEQRRRQQIARQLHA